MDGYKLSRRDRQEEGEELAPYARECLDSIELQDGDDNVECLWVRIRGKGNKVHILVGVCYGVPTRMRRQTKAL